MCFFHQSFKQFLIPKLLINFHIIFCIIFMIRKSLENRGKVNTIHTKFSQMFQMINHPLQISPIKILTVGNILGIPSFRSFRVIACIAIGKAFRENLIPNCFFDPFRCFKSVTFMEIWQTKSSIFLSYQGFIIIKHSLVSINYFFSIQTSDDE